MDRDGRRKDISFFNVFSSFFFHLKITEIEYCEKIQAFKNICRCNLKVSVAAKAEFPQTPDCGSLLNF